MDRREYSKIFSGKTETEKDEILFKKNNIKSIIQKYAGIPDKYMGKFIINYILYDDKIEDRSVLLNHHWPDPEEQYFKEDATEEQKLSLRTKRITIRECLMGNGWQEPLVEYLATIGVKRPQNALFYVSMREHNIKRCLEVLSECNLKLAFGTTLDFDDDLKRLGSLWKLVNEYGVIMLEGERKSITFIGERSEFWKEYYKSVQKNF